MLEALITGPAPLPDESLTSSTTYDVADLGARCSRMYATKAVQDTCYYVGHGPDDGLYGTNSWTMAAGDSSPWIEVKAA